MVGKFCCPKCGSENIQSCQMIYQNGVSSGTYTTTNGNETTSTRGTQITDLAASVAPPAKKDESTPLGSVFVCGILAAIFFFADHWIVAAILALLAAGAYETYTEAVNFNQKTYPSLYDDWLNSYTCHRCGNRFIMRE